MPQIEIGPHPFRASPQTVLPAWIDYNGHMNVAYYMLAFDRALDDLFDALGMGASLVDRYRMGPMALVNQITYMDELLEGQEFICDFQMLDCDAKRIHIFSRMHHVANGTVAATFEGLSINVDLNARKSAAYPAAVKEMIDEIWSHHKDLPRPVEAGATIGIRRKG